MLGCDRPSADAARAADTAVECEGAKRSPGMATKWPGWTMNTFGDFHEEVRRRANAAT